MTSSSESTSKSQKVGLKYWIGVFLVYIFISALLLILGKDPGWWQAWIYSVLVFFVGVPGRMLAEKRHPGLMKERTNLEDKTGVKKWDKILSPLTALSISFPLYIVAGLDHSNGWTNPFPVWVNVLGLILVAAGYAFATWALLENRFFSGMVRIQTDRGHTVCDTGPYKIIRHPGYGGNVLALAGIVMALSSLWTLLPAAFALIIIVTRTLLEDGTLQKELPGYKEYTQRVRYRLLPWIF